MENISYLLHGASRSQTQMQSHVSAPRVKSEHVVKQRGKGSNRCYFSIEKELNEPAVLTQMSITLNRSIMFSPDGAFINTSEILSDAEAQAIHNRVQDEVAAGNIADGRVGKFKDDPQSAAAKAYADSEVSRRLRAAILQAETKARAGQGDEDAGKYPSLFCVMLIS